MRVQPQLAILLCVCGLATCGCGDTQGGTKEPTQDELMQKLDEMPNYPQEFKDKIKADAAAHNASADQYAEMMAKASAQKQKPK